MTSVARLRENFTDHAMVGSGFSECLVGKDL